VQQTALCRSAIDVYAYCPNAPPCMMTAPPSERNQRGYTEQQMKDMLPSPDLAEQFLEVVRKLAGDDKPPKVRVMASCILLVVVVVFVNSLIIIILFI